MSPPKIKSAPSRGTSILGKVRYVEIPGATQPKIYQRYAPKTKNQGCHQGTKGQEKGRLKIKSQMALKKQARKGFQPLSAMKGTGYFQNSLGTFGNS